MLGNTYLQAASRHYNSIDAFKVSFISLLRYRRSEVRVDSAFRLDGLTGANLIRYAPSRIGT